MRFVPFAGEALGFGAFVFTTSVTAPRRYSFDRGDPLVDVSQLLGHADIRTTANIYTDWTGVKAARVAQHMDEILQDDGQMVVKMVVKQ